MIGALKYVAARGRAALSKGRAAMDVVLYVGAHRTGLTSFCAYLEAERAYLGAHDLGLWTPRQTRCGVFDGLLLPSGRRGVERRRLRGAGRLRLRLAGLARSDLQDLLVVEPRMIGGIRDNLRRERLYPAAGERMARIADAFDGHVRRVILGIRALDDFWTSSLASAVPVGASVPDGAALDRLVTQPRSWRDVVTDLACAVPGTEILVAPYERLGGHHQAIVEYATGGRMMAPPIGQERVLREAPALGALRRAITDRGQAETVLPAGWGRWRPFDAAQAATLREIYADDLHWLRAGAGGRAFLIEEAGSDRMGLTPLAGT